jgi:peptidoglycan/LPS O-acetylase OafA/YrhL
MVFNFYFSRMTADKHYFPNLTPLRFIAAFLIIVHHVEQIKEIAELPNYFNTRLVYNLGKLSVIFFFTLSGFLITYLLLAEKKEAATISIKNFYLRRLLRIWPLYFLIVFLAFFLIPQFIEIPGFSSGSSFIKNVFLHIFFLPNLALVIYGIVPMASQTWSIGTEEQFYLFWPWVLRSKMNKYLAFLAIIAGYLVIKLSLPLLPQTKYVHWLTGFWDLFNIDCMAIGGLFALLLFEQRKRLLNLFYHPYVQAITYALILILTFFPANYEIFSLFFAIIILNLSSNPKSLINLQYKPLEYLGKISYGVYMYHIIVIVAVMKVLARFGLLNNLLIYPLAILFTIAVSSLSYELFEKRFIKMKRRISDKRTAVASVSGKNVPVT